MHDLAAISANEAWKITSDNFILLSGLYVLTAMDMGNQPSLSSTSTASLISGGKLLQTTMDFSATLSIQLRNDELMISTSLTAVPNLTRRVIHSKIEQIKLFRAFSSLLLYSMKINKEKKQSCIRPIFRIINKN